MERTRGGRSQTAVIILTAAHIAWLALLSLQRHQAHLPAGFDPATVDRSIWNTPYEIDENNQDNYPLMEPWAPTPPIPTTIDELKTEIEELYSEDEIDNQGIVKSLLAKLNVAQKLVDKGKADQAKNVLSAFLREVQAQSGKHITPEAAEMLIESAEYIISQL